MKKFFALLCVLVIVIGCSTVAPPNPNTEFLLKADPSAITSSTLLDHAVASEQHYVEYHKAEGILWQGFYSEPSKSVPDRYGTGGDSLLFTGFYLAAASFRYGVTKDPADLDKVIDTIRGLYALTHTLGVPGNMARCAFPLEDSDKFNYPGHWGKRLDVGYVYTDTVTLADPFNPQTTYPQMVSYTRVSRDQLTGLAFGLGTFWKILNPNVDQSLKDNPKIAQARAVAGRIVHDVWTRLENNDFVIKDHTGRNDTADKVDGLLRLQLLSVFRHVCFEQLGCYPAGSGFAAYINEDYLKSFEDQFGFLGDPASWFNSFNNLNQYYAWNLRFSRVYTIYLLEDSSRRRAIVRDYTRSRLFSHVDNHQNPHFIYIYNAMGVEPTRLNDALFSIKATSIRPFRCYDSPIAVEGSPPSGFWKPLLKLLRGIPHFLGISDVLPAHLREPTTYFKWQEDPWDAGYVGNLAQEENAGLDFLLPYWMGRYYGFIR